MDFDNSKPIYLQIVDFFYEKILEEEWKPNERIPSVREVAMMVEVNPNTAIRAFTHLQELEVIYNKRGIGYFVADDGLEAVLRIKRKAFLEQTLPDVFKQMNLLNISLEALEEAYKRMNNEKK
ncbi:MAG: GntR family transcriptional regulator [Bacteroidota bacterium]